MSLAVMNEMIASIDKIFYISDAIADITAQNRPGILYGIGVGSGNPKQMTLQALEIIRSCDLIVLPAVSKEECYAYRIVGQVCPEISDMPLLCMPFPMIKDEKKLELAHTRIYETIEDYLRRGQIVGMLTIGDPGIYSTYLYMHKRAKENGWQAEIINGVPSFCAVAAKLGISLGEKKEEIHIIPAAYEVEDTFSYSGTCVYMKSGKRLAELLDALRSWQDKTGKIYEVWGVSNCGMAQEQVYYGLDELEKAKGYLTTVIAKQKK
ncbi:MAG TPA: precorrin-2 C(20)-methyltransferase [Lachnospira sp.]|nr:precorrin-2 C(20)-methyltransferase [Lachnospira sp.]